MCDVCLCKRRWRSGVECVTCVICVCDSAGGGAVLSV